MTIRLKPIIMTAEMGDEDFAWADRLRKRYFPPERNFLSAHVTLFHHLPPQALSEIRQFTKNLTSSAPAPKAELAKLISLGRGVAYQLHSPELLTMRMDMAENFHGLLTAQDQQKPRLHITVQNKVSPQVAKETLAELTADFEPRPFSIKGLGLHYYMDGPWETIGVWPFRGS